MIDPRQLAAVAAVVRSGSFEAAARLLGVTPSAVSQRVRALEERVGTVLIVRGQPCEATETGRRLVQHAEAVALLERDLAADIGLPSTPAARLRIAVNADSLATWVIPALAAAEGFLFDVVVDDENHSADWLRRGEVVAAVSSHAGPVQGCDSHPLGSLRYLATASPAFVARWFPEGVSAAALARAPALIFDRKDRLQARWAEQVLGSEGAALALTGHFLPSTEAFVDAAKAGLGWGMNPRSLVAADVAAGRLVALVPDAPLDVPLFWQVSRHVRQELAGLTRAMRRAAREGMGAR